MTAPIDCRSQIDFLPIKENENEETILMDLRSISQDVIMSLGENKESGRKER